MDNTDLSGLYNVVKHGLSAFIQAMRTNPGTAQNITALRESLKKMGYDFTPALSLDFVQFQRPDSSYPRDGWKFHLSIHPEDIDRALPVIMTALSESGHQGSFKVITERQKQKSMDDREYLAGKTFTIYGDPVPARLARTLEQIEEEMRKEGIRPGPHVNGDRPVPGSRYASYRNDQHKDGYYIRGNNDYNAGKHPDPYAKMFFATHTNKGFMIPVDRMNEQDLLGLKSILYERGIAYTHRSSSIAHGLGVFQIDPRENMKFLNLVDDISQGRVKFPSTQQASAFEKNPVQREMDSMLQRISNDPSLPQTVRIGSKDVALSDAIQEQSFRHMFIRCMKSAQTGDSDFTSQIDLLESYDRLVTAHPATGTDSPTAPGHNTPGHGPTG